MNFRLYWYIMALSLTLGPKKFLYRHQLVMVLVGNVITPEDVVADPRYRRLKPKQVSLELLSQYTRELQGKFDFEAMRIINTIKEEYGTGVCALVRIYNASGKTITFKTRGPNWQGHMFKYPPDYTILNGQWSVFLHVKTSENASNSEATTNSVPTTSGVTASGTTASGATNSSGSQSSVVYNVDDVNQAIFLGWGVPTSPSELSSKVYTEVNSKNHWSTVTNWEAMLSKVNASRQLSVSFYSGINCTATIGDDTSPVVNYLAAYYSK
ncbi:MAG: hypothetical protein GKR90_27960 [Pseudomonadales bacterium]|nr:hypothetical protein [Pseudomonadales bacterium]